MLTTTYSIMVLDGEQQLARRGLERLQRFLRVHMSHDNEGADPVWLEKAFTAVVTIERLYHERKIELHVVPAVRKISADAQDLLARLDSLSASASRIVGYISKQMRLFGAGGEVDADSVASTMQIFCTLMEERLALEENELIPEARRMLSPDDWFEIAAQCLTSSEKKGKGRESVFSPDIHNRSRHQQRYLH